MKNNFILFLTFSVTLKTKKSFTLLKKNLNYTIFFLSLQSVKTMHFRQDWGFAWDVTFCRSISLWDVLRFL